MVNQDVSFHLKELFEKIKSLEVKIGKLQKTETKADWDNATLMKQWQISERTAANYRKRGLGFYKRGGRIFYTPEHREKFLINYI